MTIRNARSGLLGTLIATCVLALAPSSAHAQYRGEISTIVLDANTGAVLQQDSQDLQRFPASLTKLMTLYMAFEALRDRRVTLDRVVPVSDHAASMQPSKLGLLPGTYLTVEEAILALVTKSANDAASALGELLGGDEQRFGQMMTLRARALGMSSTTFRNASGLPDPEQVTTATDLAILARHLINDFPDQYHYFSVPGFWFHGRMIPNHDPMLRTYPGADGLKTGFTDAAGCNLVTSAVRGNVRLVGVVLGARNNPQRSNVMTALLNQGFSQEGVPIQSQGMGQGSQTYASAPILMARAGSWAGASSWRRHGAVLVSDSIPDTRSSAWQGRSEGPILHGRHHLFPRRSAHASAHALPGGGARSGRHSLSMQAATTEAVSHGGAHVRAIHATRSAASHHAAHRLVAGVGRPHASNVDFSDIGIGATSNT